MSGSKDDSFVNSSFEESTEFITPTKIRPPTNVKSPDSRKSETRSNSMSGIGASITSAMGISVSSSPRASIIRKGPGIFVNPTLSSINCISPPAHNKPAANPTKDVSAASSPKATNTNSSTTAAADMASNASNVNSNIKVICRFRPENEMEKERGEVIVEFPNDSTVVVNNKDPYTFDRVFVPNSSQNDIYQYSISETVDDLMNGYNGTVLAYGQTGSGKSYTMLGTAINDPEGRGVIPRISQDIFRRIHLSSSDIEYTVGVSYMEIHMEQLKDLIDVSNNSMGDQKFQIHEDKHNGIYVKGLSQAFVSSPEELNHILLEGLKVRASVSTNMNAESSRSHAIFQIKLNQKLMSSGIIKRSHLFLVDLAGSEKVDKTGAQGQTLEEAKKINSSLSALGNVINALTDGKSTHIPYRDSKLTRILQESIGGNSRTSLIINCSPSSFNELETLSTLRFGTRAKSIKNKAHINTELSATSLRQKLVQLEKLNESNQTYIKSLETELAQWRSGERTESPFKSNAVQRHSEAALLAGAQAADKKRNTFAGPESPAKDFQAREFQIKDYSKGRLSMFTTGSNIPVNPSSSLTSSALVKGPIIVNNQEEIERRDRKIAELENTILEMKMNNVRHSHAEETKLFQLENTLTKLNTKLSDVELINQNLRKHLLISEKIIESRDVKINKLKASLKDQQMMISRETLGFKNKLGDIQEKLDSLNVEKQSEMFRLARESLIRESMYSNESRGGSSSLFQFDNKTKDTFLSDKHRTSPEFKSSFHDDDDTKVDEHDLVKEDTAKALSFGNGVVAEKSHLDHKADDKLGSPLLTERVSAGSIGSANTLHEQQNVQDKLRKSTRMSKDSPLPPLPKENGEVPRPMKKEVSELPECNLEDLQVVDEEVKAEAAEQQQETPTPKDERIIKQENRRITIHDGTSVDKFEEAMKKTSEADKRSSAFSNKTTRTVTGNTFADSKRFHKNYRHSAQDGKNQILNFHQEYLSIGEFLAESKRRNSIIDTIRRSIGDVKDLDENGTSETSGMFGSHRPNVKIAKPMRGGNRVLSATANMFH